MKEPFEGENDSPGTAQDMLGAFGGPATRDNCIVVLNLVLHLVSLSPTLSIHFGEF
jgi:hypothetical protein